MALSAAAHHSYDHGCASAQFQVQIVEVIKVFLQERVSERIVEQIMDVPVPLVVEEIVGVFSGSEDPQFMAVFMAGWRF